MRTGHAALAQLVEHRIRNAGVRGSNPLSGTITTSHNVSKPLLFSHLWAITTFQMFLLCPALCPLIPRVWGHDWGHEAPKERSCPQMSLKAAQIRDLQPSDTPYRRSDEKGLYLKIFPNGSKLWRYKYRILGREKRLALGAWPEVSLAEARKKRDDARLLVLDDIDPLAEKKTRVCR